MHAVIIARGPADGGASRPTEPPAPLADIHGKPLVDRLLDFFLRGGVSSAGILAPAGDYHRYLEWLRGRDYSGRVEIVESTCAAGPLGDLERLAKRRSVSGLVVTPGDRLYDFPFSSFARFCQERDGDSICLLNSREGTRARCGRAVTTAAGRVIDFAARNGRGSGGIAAIPLAFLSGETLALVESYLREGGDGGCMGPFLEKSFRFRPLYAWPVEGPCFHVAGRVSLKKAASHFEKTGHI